MENPRQKRRGCRRVRSGRKGVKGQQKLLSAKFRRSKHNLKILRILMEGYKIDFPVHELEYKKPRLRALEAVVTVLLAYKAGSAMPMHHDLIIREARALCPCEITPIEVGVETLLDMLGLLYPIIQCPVGYGNLIFLDDYILMGCFLGPDNRWILMECLPEEVNSTEQDGGSSAEVTIDDGPNEAKSGLPVSEGAVKRLADSSTSPPPDKVAQVDPPSVREKQGLELLDKQKPVVEKSTMTVTSYAALMGVAVADKSTNTTVSGAGDINPQQRTKNLKLVVSQKWEVFHCTICDQIPTDNVIMDVRCGALVACAKCLKRRKEFRDICLRCGHESKFIALKHLVHKVFQK